MSRNPSGRIQVRTELIALPATCGVCGIPAGPVDGRQMEFADFGLSFEFYGAFYLCERCVKELADNFGYTSPQDSMNIIGKATELYNELEKANEKIASLENALGNSLIAGLNVVVDSGGNVLSGSLNETNSAK